MLEDMKGGLWLTASQPVARLAMTGALCGEGHWSLIHPAIYYPISPLLYAPIIRCWLAVIGMCSLYIKLLDDAGASEQLGLGILPLRNL